MKRILKRKSNQGDQILDDNIAPPKEKKEQKKEIKKEKKLEKKAEKKREKNRDINGEKLKLVAISQNISDYRVGDLNSVEINTKKKLFKLKLTDKTYVYEKLLSNYMLDNHSIDGFAANCRKLSAIVANNICEGYTVEFTSSNNVKIFEAVNGLLSYNAFCPVDPEKEKSLKNVNEITSKYFSSEDVEVDLDEASKIIRLEYRTSDKTLGEIKWTFNNNETFMMNIEKKLIEVNRHLGEEYIVQLVSFDNMLFFEVNNYKTVLSPSDVKYSDIELKDFINGIKDRYSLNDTFVSLNLVSKSLDFTYIKEGKEFINTYLSDYTLYDSKYNLEKISEMLIQNGNVGFKVSVYSCDRHLLDEYFDGIKNKNCFVIGYVDMLFNEICNNLFEDYKITDEGKRLELILSAEYSDIATLYLYEKTEGTILEITKDIYNQIFNYSAINIELEVCTSNNICIYKYHNLILDYSFFEENDIEVVIK